MKLERWRWRNAIQRGLAPVSVGLVLAGAITLAKGALLDWFAVVIAIVVFVTLLRSQDQPRLSDPRRGGDRLLRLQGNELSQGTVSNVPTQAGGSGLSGRSSSHTAPVIHQRVPSQKTVR